MTKPPTRSDGLIPTHLADIQHELHDIKRVYSQGQEEDLKMALSTAITRIEGLSSMLIENFKAQTEIQTELTLCKSNLQLALANNEMLEDALQRDTVSRGKDLGWRRQPSVSLEGERSSNSFEFNRQPTHSPIPQTAGPAQTDTKFLGFKFRAPGSGRSTPQPSPSITNGVHTSHLASASLSSLVPVKDKEMEGLNLELERERKAHKLIVNEKKKLEEELESLSQALFEEANKMVASERMRLADTEAELREVRDEKEALRRALRLLEDENGRYRSVLSSDTQDVSNLPPLSSGSRANSLPPTSPLHPSMIPRPRSALSEQQPPSSPSSRSNSPSSNFVKLNLDPHVYEATEGSPWAEDQSAVTPTSSFINPHPPNVGQSRSLPPPPIEVPPWSAADFVRVDSTTPGI